MAKAYTRNTEVSWKWGNGEGKGKIIEIHTSKVSKFIKGEEVTRNATQDNPAYLIKQENGSIVLKLHSEIIQPSSKVPDEE